MDSQWEWEDVYVNGLTRCGNLLIIMSIYLRCYSPGEMHFIPSGADSWFSLPRDQGVAYAAQESWVQNDTIRENILFGTPYDEDRYRKGEH